MNLNKIEKMNKGELVELVSTILRGYEQWEQGVAYYMDVLDEGIDLDNPEYNQLLSEYYKRNLIVLNVIVSELEWEDHIGSDYSYIGNIHCEVGDLMERLDKGKFNEDVFRQKLVIICRSIEYFLKAQIDKERG